jgi:DNA-binding MarR family transcriptional regulator
MRELRVAAHATQARAGISAAQLFVLAALGDGEEHSLSDLAKRTMTDRTSVAAVVDRLLDAGLVTRGTSSVDRRRAAVTLTRKGHALLARAPDPPTALLVSGLERLTAAQLAQLAKGLTALSGAMGLGEEPAGFLFDDS